MPLGRGLLVDVTTLGCRVLMAVFKGKLLPPLPLPVEGGLNEAVLTVTTL